MVRIAPHIRKLILSVALTCSCLSTALADVLNIRADAPTTYVVVKGDTLWDISNLFLDEPWLWPELWRHNTQIENPHLIYPGDKLTLRYENGQPVLELDREKHSLVLTPGSRVSIKPNPISMLPWSSFAPYVRNGSMMPAREYRRLPTLLGDNLGTPRFADKDYVLAHKLPDPDQTYQVVRKQREVYDSDGNSLGMQITHLSAATVSNSLSDDRQVVRLNDATMEAKQGDKLIPFNKFKGDDLRLAPANAEVGEIVESLNGNVLIGRRDVVIVNLGASEVKPGTVFGIYKKGDDVVYDKEKVYRSTTARILELFSTKQRVEQPAYKIGELIVLRSFENASYAWVTKTDTHIRKGDFIAKP